MLADFDPQPVLTGDAFRLRPMAAGDLDPLFAVAGEPELWAQHPARERWRHEVFAPYFEFLLGTGTTLVFEDRARGDLAGCSRYYDVPDQPSDIAIGFTMLGRAWWGGASNRAIKTLMLGHAFASYQLVWFHIAPENIRSQRGTAKLGAVHDYDAVLDLGTGPAELQCWRLPREVWEGA
ncbi:MAG: GNAT family N-acetyltransferase [Pseudomonadota bacterium]